MSKATAKKQGMNNFGKKGWAIVFYVLLIYLFSCVINDTINVTMGVFAGVLGTDQNSLLPFAAVGGFVGVILSLVSGAIIAKKQVKVGGAIFDKEVEIELTEVDKSEFVKGVMKGTPKLTAGILDNFGIMFKEEKKEDDFSELDALMAE